MRQEPEAPSPSLEGLWACEGLVRNAGDSSQGYTDLP